MIVEKKPGIYLIFCLANQRVYVGQSKNVKSRLGVHQTTLRCGYHSNDYLQNAYDKYGVDMFVFRPCEYPEDITVENLTVREQYWIDRFDSMNPRRGFNMKTAGPAGYPNEETRAKIGEASKGRRHTDETKAKMSNAGKGKKRSDETKAKMSEAAKGIPKSDEQKSKQSTTMKGRLMPEETKAKLSTALKGRIFTDEHKVKISEALKGNNHALKGKLRNRNPDDMVII